MNRSQCTAVIVGVLSVSITAAVAQLTAPAGLDLSWNTVDGGGGSSTGGAFSINGTIGQPDAGFTLVGGNIELTGGFWPASGSGVDPCPADVNGDLIVSLADLLAVISNWGQSGPNPADVNIDGIVNLADLLAVIAAWGACPP